MTNDLLSNPPHGVIDVFATTFSIFKEHWKHLGLIAIFQLLSLFGTVIVLAIITGVIAAAYIAQIMDIIKNLGQLNSELAGRALLEYTVGVHGASRLLEGYDYYGDFEMDDDMMPNIITGKDIAIFFSIGLLWISVISIVMSIFLGTFYHSLANIYSGGFPGVRESMNHGVSRMWTVYFFQILYSVAVLVVFCLMVALPFQVSKSLSVTFFMFLVFIITMAFAASLMVGATPAIVVERKSATEAFGRSINLCKSFVCFIFCSQFTFFVAVFIVSILFNMMFSHLPGLLAGIGHMVVNIISNAIAPVFVFVLYMSMRIRKENVSQEDIALEIGNTVVATAIDMEDDDAKYAVQEMT